MRETVELRQRARRNLVGMTSMISRVDVAHVLRAAGILPPENRRKLMTCPLPSHRDGTPSFRLFERGWICFGCNQHGGLLDLVIALGICRDRAGAARWLEGTLR